MIQGGVGRNSDLVYSLRVEVDGKGGVHCGNPALDLWKSKHVEDFVSAAEVDSYSSEVHLADGGGGDLAVL